jgi:hypothetical protein
MAVASERSTFLLTRRYHSGLKMGALVAALAVTALVFFGCLHGFGENAERYFPLKQGLSWTYRVSTTVFSLPISGEMKVTNLP